MSNIAVKKSLLLAGLGTYVSASALRVVCITHLAEGFQHLILVCKTVYWCCMFRSEFWFWAICKCEERLFAGVFFSSCGSSLSPKWLLAIPAEVSVTSRGALLFMNLILTGCFLLTTSSATEEHTVIVQKSLKSLAEHLACPAWENCFQTRFSTLKALFCLTLSVPLYPPRDC